MSNRKIAVDPSPVLTAEDNSAASVTDRLIRQFMPAEEIFEVRVGTEVLTFRALHDRAEYLRLMKRAKEFSKVSSSPNPEINEYLQTDANTKVLAYVIASMSDAPKFTPEMLLEMAKKSVFLFEAIKDAYLVGVAGSQIEADKEAIEESKNE